MTDSTMATPVPEGPAVPGTSRHRIVVGTDGSDGAAQAVEWAALRAARTGSVLEVHTAYGSGYVFVSPTEVQEAMARLGQQAVAHVREIAPSVVATAVGHEGPPVESLVEASSDADLLVVGSRGLGGFTGLVLGSVGHKCALHARCPVVVVREPDGRAAALPGPVGSSGAGGRLVVGVDGSPSSDAALEWAFGEAELTGDRVVAVTCWEWPNSFAWGMPVPAGFSMADDAATIVEQALDPVRKAHPSVAVESKVVHGHPAPTLVSESEEARMVLVGNRGHGEFVGSLLGSVSEHCVSHAHCPVLVMRRRAAPAEQGAAG
ncbi:MAG TPA: universal stress protein [Acidimicrobiales bacterium]|nr:universal stress protein [Acidimicrobiales bacterium]